MKAVDARKNEVAIFIKKGSLKGNRRVMMDQHNNLFGFFTQLFVNPLSPVLTLSIVFAGLWADRVLGEDEG